ncbi:Uncharacterised protein [Mycobacteroides abscessus subsp. abscessus]|nr:Uncharacterised protein [Mycobacteroides abscessus subsp. abscessus]SIJ98232.1 Uncharacterised protein [Mycobacteroides abscessus subsp. abscessus]SIL62529.1 Uncharacterised protein [Mycobacteroides abscessus subsp. abscessus]SLF09168.1 Uncharacterised protein [Mycobacteroides abscessus subsp. abscessus]
MPKLWMNPETADQQPPPVWTNLLTSWGQEETVAQKIIFPRQARGVCRVNPGQSQLGFDAMSFRVTYPVGSTFAAPNPQDGAEPFEEFSDEDAYAFLPGGVLGIWSNGDRRTYFLPHGQWVLVSANGHSPGRHKEYSSWQTVSALFTTPPPELALCGTGPHVVDSRTRHPKLAR